MTSKLQKLLSSITIIASFLCAASVAIGQQTGTKTQNVSAAVATAVVEKQPELKDNKSDNSTKPASSQKPDYIQPEWSRRLSRWFELQTAMVYTQYRVIENTSGVLTKNTLEHKETFLGRFKFDAAGNYTINAFVQSGTGFISSWNNTGAGLGDMRTNLSLKQAYFAAKPVQGLEIQYGGLFLNRGQSTEITSYDNDGYIVGERVSVKRPKELYLDEISVTYGYLGDSSLPNLDKRFHRLTKSNYHQFLVAKKVGDRVSLSADYTFEAGRETMREAVKVNARELHVVDFLRFENYQRFDTTTVYGFAAYGEKQLRKRVAVGGGYASIDRYYGGLNADRFGNGNRLFANATVKLVQDLSTTIYVTRAVGNDYALGQKTRMDLLVSYDLLAGLRRMGLY
ncbi:MAG TPA: hypothetical protein VFC63_04030 [Blastocatellia bacterium]|nr:hypothetical protein [Blastocatellia bacterium]